MIALCGILLASPLAISWAIAESHRARSFIGAHYATCIVVGWSAVLLVAPAVVLLEGSARVAALAVLCPLMALSVWRRDGGGDDDGGGEDDPEPSLPDSPGVDWEQFMRALDEYSKSCV
jgi:hypothetical protein